MNLKTSKKFLAGFVLTLSLIMILGTTVQADTEKLEQKFNKIYTNITEECGSYFVWPVTLVSGDGEITYTSSNPECVKHANDLGDAHAAPYNFHAIKTGKSTITIRAEETDNYKALEQSFEVTVTKGYITIPRDLDFKYAYTGQDISFGTEFNLDLVEISGDSTGKYVGKYNATAIIKDKDSYAWGGTYGDVTDKEYPWEIIPVTPEILISSGIKAVRGQTLNLKKLTKFNITNDYLGNREEYVDEITFALKTPYEGIAISGDSLIVDETAEFGNVWIRANFAGKDLGGSPDLEYTSSYKDFCVEIISKTKVKKPTAESTTFVYNRNSQRPEILYEDLSKMVKVGGGWQVNVGNYEIEYTLKDTVGCCWEDDEIDPVKINWSITPRGVKVSAGTCEVVKEYDGSITKVNYSGELEIDGILSGDTLQVKVLATPQDFSRSDCYTDLEYIRIDLVDAAGKNNYKLVDENEVEVERILVPYTILQKDITSTIVVKVIGDYDYTGSAIEPTVVVTANEHSTSPIFTTEYLVTYENNIDAGTDARVIVSPNPEGKLNYIWEDKTQTFTINKVNYDREINAINEEVQRNKSATYEIKLSEITLPAELKNASIAGVTYAGELISSATSEDSKVTYVVESKPADTTGTLILTISSKNYNDVEVIVNVKTIAKSTSTGGGSSSSKKDDKKEEVVEPVTPVVTEELPFIDVSQDDWFYDAIKFVEENKLMNGTAGDMFEPNAATTRAMLVTILYRLENEPEVLTENIFSDVEKDAWYEKSIAWASENKIVLGTGDGMFNPTGLLTREQLVTILYRYASYKKLDVSKAESTNILSYNDAFNISEYAILPFQWACGESLVSGVGENLLDPYGFATRAQIATIMMRFIK